MSQHTLLATVGLLASLAAGPALAQEGERDREGQALVLYAHGGGFSPLTHLDQAGNVDFETGYNVGGGFGYQIDRHLTLRANFTFARAEAQDTVGLSGISATKFNRFLYDADLQFRYPLAGGAAPYVFVGGGVVNVKQDITPDQPSFTKGAGKVGLGLSYQIPKSSVGLYVEGTGWIYKWDRYGFNKTQFDTTWSGGLTYRFGI